MLIKNKLKNLFAKKESQDLLGISLCQKSLSFCYIPENEASECHVINVNESNVVGALSEMQKKHSPKGQLHLVLSPQQTQIVQVDKPNVPEEEINGALKWQVKDLVSFTPENMLVDYFDGPKHAGANKVNVVCANLTDIKAIVESLIQHDFSPKSITTEEFAFASLVPVQDEACLLVCQQPTEEIVLIIVKQGKLFFHRRLRGFAQISHKSEDELGMGVIDSLSLEIQRSSDYFERQLKQAPIKSIEVIVPIDNEGFLARKLSENTNVPVNLLAMPNGFDTQRKFAVAIGATQLTMLTDEAELIG